MSMYELLLIIKLVIITINDNTKYIWIYYSHTQHSFDIGSGDGEFQSHMKAKA